MKANNGAVRKEIDGEAYLFPYGQMIEQNVPAIKLSEFGEIVWDMLQKETDSELILSALARHFGATAEERPALEADLGTFINQLKSCGYIKRTDASYIYKKKYQIGGINICVESDFDITVSQLDAFACDFEEADLSIAVTTGMVDTDVNGGSLLLCGEDAVVSSFEDGLHVHFPGSKLLNMAHISCDLHRCCFYISPIIDENTADELFFAIRFSYLLYAKNAGLFAMHSASVLYNGKLWLFTGPSGTGKSTHTGLWKKLFDTPVVNGDLNLIGLSGDGATIYGIPWCGTSGIFSEKDYPLGGIVILSQDKNNTVERLSKSEAVRRISKRFITPAMTEKDMSELIDFSTALTDRVPVFSLRCNMDDAAAVLMHETISAL